MPGTADGGHQATKATLAPRRTGHTRVCMAHAPEAVHCSADAARTATESRAQTAPATRAGAAETPRRPPQDEQS